MEEKHCHPTFVRVDIIIIRRNGTKTTSPQTFGFSDLIILLRTVLLGRLNFHTCSMYEKGRHQNMRISESLITNYCLSSSKESIFRFCNTVSRCSCELFLKAGAWTNVIRTICNWYFSKLMPIILWYQKSNTYIKFFKGEIITKVVPFMNASSWFFSNLYVLVPVWKLAKLQE